MTPKDLEADMLQVFAEPYNTLILDKLAFKNSIPKIEGLAPKENIKALGDTIFRVGCDLQSLLTTV